MTTIKASQYVWNGFFLVILFYFVVSNVLYRRSLPIYFTYTEPYRYKLNPFYAPSRIERFALEHSVALNYHLSLPADPTKEKTLPPRGCELWKRSPLLISDYLQSFKQEMALYNQLLRSHPGVRDLDVRDRLNSSCPALHLHPQGLAGIFTSGSLSRGSTGLLEPFYPPFASLSQKCSYFHWWRSRDELDFLVHDFPSICKTLQPNSKIILVDVGYDVSSKWNQPRDSPTLSLLRLYEKFGFPVDAIYVFDSLSSNRNSKSQKEPWATPIRQVFDWESPTRSLHEMTSKDTPSERQNPWDWIVHNFAITDLIVVTLQLPPRHVDPTVEIKLLEEIPSSAAAHTIDALYFHPRVYMAEDEPKLPPMKNSTEDEKENFRWTVRDALRFFTKLREKGIHAHAFAS